MSHKLTLSIFILLLLSTINSFSQQTSLNKEILKQTLTYSTKDTAVLKMDIYSNDVLTVKKPCVVFVFGGGFITGSRDASLYQLYFNRLAENNYKVISIDYRLGLKGAKWPTIFNTSVLKNAIAMAVTDLYDATGYLISNAERLGIDTSQVILSGSSAGAITVLQADWEKRNHTTISKSLPENFQYKGVIAFAGAILSYTGKPKYHIPPAPTMMFHGTEDKVVIYNKVKLFNRGMFGSRYLARFFKKQKYPYYFQLVRGAGHEIAGTPMKKNLNDILWFIDTYIFKKKTYLMEVDFTDPSAPLQP